MNMHKHNCTHHTHISYIHTHIQKSISNVVEKISSNIIIVRVGNFAFTSKESLGRDREMAQQSRTLAVVPDNPGLIPNTHIVTPRCDTLLT